MRRGVARTGPRGAATSAAGAARPRATGGARAWRGTAPARSARLEPGPGGRGAQVALERALGRLADRHDPGLGALAEHPQLLGVEVDVADVEVHDLLAAQAAGVGELEHRAVAQPRAACAPGCGRAAARPRRCAAPSAAARPAAGDGDQVGGVLVELPALDHVTEERTDRGELARDRGRRQRAPALAPLRRRGARRSGAGAGSRPRSGATPASVAQRGELARRRCRRRGASSRPCRARRAGGRTARARRARPGFGSPSPTIIVGCPSSSTSRPAASRRTRSWSRPVRRRRTSRPRFRGTRCRARATPRPRVYSVLRKQVRGRERDAWIGTLCIRHGDRQASLESQGWQEVTVDEMRAGPQPSCAARYWM